jgi:hydrogenase maturation factor
MCLPETVLLVEVHGEGVERWGVVTREGKAQRAGLAYVPEANVGDLLLVHSGQAFRIVNDQTTPEGPETAAAS